MADNYVFYFVDGLLEFFFGVLVASEGAVGTIS